MDACGRRWTQNRSVPACVDECGPPRTPLGDLRNRRLGIRVPPGVPQKPCVSCGFAAFEASRRRTGERSWEPFLGAICCCRGQYGRVPGWLTDAVRTDDTVEMGLAQVWILSYEPLSEPVRLWFEDHDAQWQANAAEIEHDSVNHPDSTKPGQHDSEPPENPHRFSALCRDAPSDRSSGRCCRG